MAEEKKKDERTRNWAVVLYPESVVENWKDILNEQHIPWVQSPLHDKDTNPNGENKKPHWHIALMFGSKKSYKQICDIVESLGGGAPPQRIENMKGMIRYFLHMDNPEKAQYDKSELLCYGGADISKYLTNTGGDKLKILSEMQEWINDNDCVEFSDLAEYARTERFDDWYEVIVNQSTIFLTHYIRSRRYNSETIKKQNENIEKYTELLKIENKFDSYLRNIVSNKKKKEYYERLIDRLVEIYGESIKDVTEENKEDLEVCLYKKIKDEIERE